MKKINIKLMLTDKTALAITKYFYKREMRKRYNHE